MLKVFLNSIQSTHELILKTQNEVVEEDDGKENIQYENAYEKEERKKQEKKKAEQKKIEADLEQEKMLIEFIKKVKVNCSNKFMVIERIKALISIEEDETSDY